MTQHASLRSLLARFPLDREANAQAIWKAIGIAAVLGALYGAFVSPLWAEAVEFAQAWAGLVPYEHSPWGAVMLADPSLQITIPALLLLAGVKVWPLSQMCTAFFSAVSFSAMAAASFAFTRHVLLSVATPLLLLTFHFSNAHGYPVAYPVMWFQFGQTGMYVCVLALCLLACGFPLIAGFTGGLLAGVHLVWLPCFLMGAFPAAFLQQRAVLPRLSAGLILGAVLAAGFLYVANHSLLPPHAAYQPPTMPAAISNTDGSGQSTNAGEQKIRGTFNAHNTLFRDAAMPAKEAFEFFLPEMVFVLLIISLSLSWQNYNVSAAQRLFAHRLLLQVSITVAATFLFKIYEEADPYFALFGFIDHRLPALILRAIMNRWLNLTNVLIPVMMIALFALQARNKSWAGAAAFVLAALFLGLARKPFWYIGGFLLLALAIYRLKGGKKKDVSHTDESRIFVTALTLGFIFIKILFLSVKVFETKSYAGNDAAESLAKVASADSGPLIVSSGVISINNFSPQLRTGRATIVPDKLDVYDTQTSQVIHVFCLTDRNKPLGQFYADVKPCFESRTPQEWNVIAHETTATGMITPDSWKLQMPPLISAGGFSYYRF